MNVSSMALYQLVVIGSLFGIYLGAVLFLIYVAFFSSAESNGVVRATHLYFFKKLPTVIGKCFPSFVHKAYGSCVDYTFFQRNRVFTTLYGLLQLAVFVQFFADVVPLSAKVSPSMQPSRSASVTSSGHDVTQELSGTLGALMGGGRAQHLRMAVICWMVNLSFWAMCLFSNPGVITAQNVKELTPIYESRDQRMRRFNKASNVGNKSNDSSQNIKSGSTKEVADSSQEQYKQCRTCHTDKMLRSKHCSSCDVCVWRADHHCVWINNCVGGGNTVFFHLFLASLVLESFVGAYALWGVVKDAAAFARLWEMRYRDTATQRVYPVNSFIVAQHMFKQFPRIVCLDIFYLLLGSGVFVFFLFHQLLVLSNYTTREMFSKKKRKTIEEDDVTGKSKLQDAEPRKAGNKHSACPTSSNQSKKTSDNGTEVDSGTTRDALAIGHSKTDQKPRNRKLKQPGENEASCHKKDVDKNSQTVTGHSAPVMKNSGGKVVKHGVNIHDLLAQDAKPKKPSIFSRLLKLNSTSQSMVNKFTLSNSPYNYGFLLNILDAFVPKICYSIRLRLKI